MEDQISKLGPLAALAGVFEGDRGVDVAPSDSRGREENRYRERAVLEPIGLVENHEQKLYGLRYAMTAWRIDEVDAFHEEVGYWLWDSSAHQAMKCFIVPRGVSVIAGGTVAPDATRFALSAEVGSSTYGICSNRFLDGEFRSLRYSLSVEITEDGFRYAQDTELLIKGQDEVFHHTDENVLKRIG